MRAGLLYIFAIAIPLLSSICNAQPNQQKSNPGIIVKDKDHIKLKAYFRQLDQIPGQLDDITGKLLLDLLPKTYQGECKKLVSGWGEKAGKSSETAVRAIYLASVSDKLQQIFLVFTCFSSGEGFGDKFYDERLAILSIEGERSSLSILPDVARDSCNQLTRIGLGDEDIQIGGTPVILIHFDTRNNSPSSKAIDTVRTHRLKFFILSKTGAAEILSLVKNHEEKYRGTGGGDSTVIEKSDLEYIKDNSNNITAIVIQKEKSINSGSPRINRIWYRWNSKKRSFEDSIN